MLKGKTVNLSYGEKKSIERKCKRSDNTVNLSDTEKERIKEKYRDAYRKKPKKRKERKDITPMENDNGDNGSFFKYAYRFYYLLDMPADEAYRCFRVCMRGADEGKVVAYLYEFGMKNRSELIDTVKRSTVEYREGIEEKFEFIKDKIKNNMFERLTK